jgi:hypothetical protein
VGEETKVWTRQEVLRVVLAVGHRLVRLEVLARERQAKGQTVAMVLVLSVAVAAVLGRLA